MDSTSTLTEAEKSFRWEVVLALLPHYGKNTDQLLAAAISIQEHTSGHRPEPLSSIASTA